MKINRSTVAQMVERVALRTQRSRVQVPALDPMRPCVSKHEPIYAIVTSYKINSWRFVPLVGPGRSTINWHVVSQWNGTLNSARSQDDKLVPGIHTVRGIPTACIAMWHASFIYTNSLTNINVICAKMRKAVLVLCIGCILLGYLVLGSIQ